MIKENKRRLKALSQIYPGQLELRAPLQGATPLSLRSARAGADPGSLTGTGPRGRAIPVAGSVLIYIGFLRRIGFTALYFSQLCTHRLRVTLTGCKNR